MEPVDILSFDGGGSRGIMEVAVMEDVMKLATILWRNPESLEYLIKSADALKDPEIVKKVVSDLNSVGDPIHPTEVYDMIVGTSTGALIAFGLVGGNVELDGTRSPMTLGECTEMYLAKTKRIFRKSLAHYLLPCNPLSKLVSYSSKNVKEVLKGEFQGCRLRDFKDNKTVAGAVTKRIGLNERLVLFDTKTEIYGAYKIADVLLASTNAPVYFKTPIKIGGNEFVDGGVGGNCPLVQAVPRAKEIFGTKVRSALSIAPPAPDEAATVPKRWQFTYWLNYFINQSTGGAAVYREAKSRHKSIIFRRLAPRGQRLKQFEMDEVDAEEMLTAMEDEKFNNHMFLVDIVATATAVIDTYFAKSKNSADATAQIAAKLAQIMGKVYASEGEYEVAEDAYRTAINLWEKSVSVVGNDDEARKRETQIEIAHTYDDIGQTWIDQSKLREAADLYRESVKRWRKIYGVVNHVDCIANATYKLAVSCHLLGSYDEAHEHYEEALRMRLQVYGDTDKANIIAAMFNHIGKCYYDQEMYQKALEKISEALEIRRMLYQGQDDLKLAKTINSLGICLINLKKFEDGEKYIKESFEMRKRLLSEEKANPDIAGSLNDLGWCFMLQGKYEDAQQYLQKALQMFKRQYKGKAHHATADVLKNFARLKLNQGDYNASITYATQSIATIKACFGDVDNLIIAKALNIIGNCFYNRNKTQVAITYLTEAVEMMRRVFGEGFYPTLADAEVDLGKCFMAVAKYHHAKGQFEDAIRIQTKVGGETTGILGYLEECNEKLAGKAAKNVPKNNTSDQKLRLLP